MPRVSKKKLLIFIFGVGIALLYCEFLIYYVVISQCSWPNLRQHGSDQALRALLLTDIHLMGPRNSFRIDKWRREWQMHRGFQTMIALHKPEVVFVLGDLFDEGEYSNDVQFKNYVDQFHNSFYVPNGTKMYILVGNHDIGFHNNIKQGHDQRFFKMLNSPSVQSITLKNNIFVLINSIAMEGDSCKLCTEARRNIDKISENLNCMENPLFCNNTYTMNYSQPVLLQHFPLYRESDAICNEPDEAPASEKDTPFRLKIDCLSKEATEDLIAKIRPRVMFGGHTHYGCQVRHKINNTNLEFDEYSIPSFSWKNIRVPKYMLLTVTPEEYAANKCGLPREETLVITLVLLLSVTVYIVRIQGRRKGTWEPLDMQKHAIP